jgi:Derlin-2/3
LGYLHKLINLCYLASLIRVLHAVIPGLDFLFHMFFLSRYCKLLEETSFRGRTADFFYMLIFGGVLLTTAAPFVNIQFLGHSLTFMMVSV